MRHLDRNLLHSEGPGGPISARTIGQPRWFTATGSCPGRDGRVVVALWWEHRGTFWRSSAPPARRAGVREVIGAQLRATRSSAPPVRRVIGARLRATRNSLGGLFIVTRRGTPIDTPRGLLHRPA